VAASTKDYYEILGIPRDASETEIKKAFRRRARETHPDVNGHENAEEEFKACNEAYDVLSDPAKKQMYDTYGTADPRAAGPGPGDFAGFGMEDLFSVRITLEEAALGTEKEVVLSRLVPCDECSATGSADGTGASLCPECSGSGQKQTYRKTFLGTMSTVVPCENCSATGQVVTAPCPECQGQGRVPDREHVTVTIPAGIDDGQQLRLRNMGEAGVRGAAAGDLIVAVRVAPHEYLHREGNDLHCRSKISISQAALGADIKVTGITDDIDVSVPAGTQHGDTVRVRGRGMPNVRGTHTGDLIVHMNIDVPRKLNKRQRELLKELGETFGDAKQRSTIEKLHDWLSG
jgi:molecular chaperone DnaJ